MYVVCTTTIQNDDIAVWVSSGILLQTESGSSSFCKGPRNLFRNHYSHFIVCCSKVNSVQEAYANCFGVHTLKFEILQITWQNEAKNISFQFLSLLFICRQAKLLKIKITGLFFYNKSSILILFVFSCGLQDFKFWYVNRKAFGASIL